MADSTQSPKLDELIRVVQKANAPVVKRALNGTAQATPTSNTVGERRTSQEGQGVSQTACEPDYTESDRPLDLTREVDLHSMPLQDFLSAKECLGFALVLKVCCVVVHGVFYAIDNKCTPTIKAQCSCLRVPSITIYIVDYEVWLAKNTDSEVTLAAGDLFGLALVVSRKLQKVRPCLNQITLALVVFDHVNALTLDIYCARYLIQSKRLAGVAAARPKDCIP